MSPPYSGNHTSECWGAVSLCSSRWHSAAAVLVWAGTGPLHSIPATALPSTQTHTPPQPDPNNSPVLRVPALVHTTLSVYLSIYLSVCLSVYLSICLSIS